MGTDEIWSSKKVVSEADSGAAKYFWGEADVSWAVTCDLGSLKVPVLSATVCGVTDLQKRGHSRYYSNS